MKRSERERASSPAILLVEDDPGIVDFVQRGLAAAGFTVEAELDGTEGGRQALRSGFDLIVLDLMLPGRSGLEILASVRQTRPNLPVIVLTARGEVDDRVVALDAGAVDYLVKPFSVAELSARVRAQLRQAGQATTGTLSGAGVEVDLLSRRVRHRDQQIRLSSTEFELLVYLLRHRGRVLSREQILSAVWGYEHDPGTNIVDVYIGYLRRRLRVAEHPAPIFTVRAVGYRLGDAA